MSEEHFRAGTAGPVLVRRQGAGPAALTFIHGITADGSRWRELQADLAARWSSQAIDLRGHGWSTRAETYRVIDYAADLIEILQGSAPQVLIGHSLGGLVALQVAAMRPDLVRGLIIEDAPLFHRSEGIDARPELAAAFAAEQARRRNAADHSALLQALAAERPEADLAKLRHRADQHWRCDPGIWQPILDNTLSDGATGFEGLAAVSCPTLLLRGDPERGAALDPRASGALVQIMPNCRELFFAGSGHGILGDAGERYRSELIAFLESPSL
jgi:pimeloyl-ACP methyl ester carboxylesterase